MPEARSKSSRASADSAQAKGELLLSSFEKWVIEEQVEESAVARVREAFSALVKRRGRHLATPIAEWLYSLPPSQFVGFRRLILDAAPQLVDLPELEGSAKRPPSNTLGRISYHPYLTQKKARQSPPVSATASQMKGLTAALNSSSRNSYVAPSRAGKKQLMGYFDEETIKTLRALALTRGTTLQGLLEEAVADLMSKHSDDLLNVQHFLKREP